VITAEAQGNIERHIATMRARGHRIEQQDLPAAAGHGTFVPPTIIEIGHIADVEREVFGPVLHVLRYRRDDLSALIDAINATGYGLTFGLHTRLDATIAEVTARVKAGNLYVNRNVIGAIVGVQPFGGHGLSGTGPKAGGPLYLGRLVHEAPVAVEPSGTAATPLSEFAAWLEAQGEAKAARAALHYGTVSALGAERTLSGPVGEDNLYALHPRGRILMRPVTTAGLHAQIAAVLATGNRGTLQGMALPAGLPPRVAAAFAHGDEPIAAALVEGDAAQVAAVAQELAERDGPIVTLLTPSPAGYPTDLLLEEVSISINTTAAGGNASLMTIG